MADPALPPIIFLMGPTATGKTALAVDLLEQLPVEIVSVDSGMVYKGMDIGTAKPSRGVLAMAPHRLIDICAPTESYSAGRFREDAHLSISDIQSSSRIPLLVGGTGLYFRTLEKGFSALPEADPQIRRRLSRLCKEYGSQYLYRRLQSLDPEASTRINPNDPQRIQRALEVYEITKTPLSSVFAEGRQGAFSGKIVKIILLPSDREALYERIEKRFLRMLDAGFIDEVEGLYQRDDMHAGMTSMRMVGYRQIWRYLAGEIDRSKMCEQAVVATRQLAKRQITWLRGERDAVTFDSLSTKKLQGILKFLGEDPTFSSQFII